ncbi:MAG: hypothetical protein O2782_14565 [bacterium]|nr:hypothetical protein [bacterium]
MKILLLSVCLTGAFTSFAFGQQGETAYLSVGFHTYDPALNAVRSRLKDAGGGRLEMIDKGRQALFVSLQTLGPVSAGQQLGRGISAFRYRGRSQVDDYLVELEHFSGSLVSINVGDHGDMRPYWGGGIDVVRMKREGSVVVRDAPRVTQKDWLWGLHLEAGFEYFVSDYLAVGSKAFYLYSLDSSFDGIDYALDDIVLTYHMTLVFRD